MSADLHQAYVSSLLNGSGLARTRGGKTVAFRRKGDVVGSGFWGDLWGKTKSFANKILPTLVGSGKDALMSGLNAGLNGTGSMKERAMAGLRGAGQSVLSQKDHLLNSAKQAGVDAFL